MQPSIPSIDEKKFRQKVQTDKKPFIVIIGADWCGNCHILDPILESLASRYNHDLAFTKLNIDTSEEIAADYGVSELPIILFFKNGQLFNHTIGLISRKNLTSMIDKLLCD
jgi:thioredoxin 1